MEVELYIDWLEILCQIIKLIKGNIGKNILVIRKKENIKQRRVYKHIREKKEFENEREYEREREFVECRKRMRFLNKKERTNV